MMEQSEVTAELFRIIRNFQDHSKTFIMNKIKDELSDATEEQIKTAFLYIIDRSV